VDVGVTGSRGLIGNALVASLRADGHRVVRFVRGADDEVDAIPWDPARGTFGGSGVEGLDAVVHLAGEGIGERRWSEAQKRRIRDSRVDGTRAVAEAVRSASDPPEVVISASAIGYYGLRGDEWLTEDSTAGSGFMAEVVQDWEAAIGPIEDRARVVRLRSGVVLSPRGGALRRQLPLFRLGVGGRLGSGRQYLSWISLTDEVHAIRWLLEHPVSGPVNATAPNPVTNREFTETLAAVLHRPAVLPVPALGPRVLFGREMTEQVVFASQRVRPAVLEAGGFTFEHPTVEAGLRAELGRP
jgi:uncharacterized protein (TIGR01777 family)